MLSGCNRVLLTLLLITLWPAASQALPQVDPGEWRVRYFTAENLAKARARFGEEGYQRLINWQQLLEQGQAWSEEQKLTRTNQFFNQVPFISDQQHWGRRDYWATPAEFLGSNGGDCEDFSVAKYRTLLWLGVPRSRLRLIYAKALELNQAHMVLGYYETPSSMPLILDNLNPAILSAAERRDLAPVYSFSGDGLWQAKAQGRGRQIGDDITEIDLVVDLMWRIENIQINTPAASGRQVNSQSNRGGR